MAARHLRASGVLAGTCAEGHSAAGHAIVKGADDTRRGLLLGPPSRGLLFRARLGPLPARPPS